MRETPGVEIKERELLSRNSFVLSRIEVIIGRIAQCERDVAAIRLRTIGVEILLSNGQNRAQTLFLRRR